MYNSIWFIVERGSVQQQRSGRCRHRPKLELGAGGTCAPYRTVIVELKGCALVGGSEGDELIAGASRSSARSGRFRTCAIARRLDFAIGIDDRSQVLFVSNCSYRTRCKLLADITTTHALFQFHE